MEPTSPCPDDSQSHAGLKGHGPECSLVKPHERRWPALLATMVAFALQSLAPEKFDFIGGEVPASYIMVVVLAILWLPILSTPRSPERERPLLRWCAIAVPTVLLLWNLVYLVHLFYILLYEAMEDGRPGISVAAGDLIKAGLVIWGTNVLATAIAYWEMDRGGSSARDPRRGTGTGRIDLLFPQDTGVPGVAPGSWNPTFTDYLFVAFTSATTFGPADAMPLTGRAKLLMMTASTVSLITIIGLAARLINGLSS